MSNDPTLWKREARPPPQRGRMLVWLGLLAAVALGCWLLTRAFPEQGVSSTDTGNAIYLFTLLALISGGVVFSRQFYLREALRNIALWAGIAAFLAVCYLYQDVFTDIGARLQAAIVPGAPLVAGAHTLVLSEGEDGGYSTVGEVNGVRVRFLVDTGASDIVLSPSDARRVGVDMTALHFIGETETANGTGHGAPCTLDSLAVGPVRLSHVEATVNQAPMEGSLLGMSFLRRLKSFEIKEHRLYLHW